jgi:hypothetical protein
MLKFAAFAVALVATSPVVAGVPAPQPAPTTAKAPDPLDKVVCRTEDTLGSRLSAHRVCATLRDWKEQEAENRAAAEKMQQQGQTNPSGN